jgi:signal transduction histidine kinase/CheY-like chemotaxis protein
MIERESRLGVACRLTDVMIGVGSERALNLVEEWHLPTAVLDVARRAAPLVNNAWRALFGTRDAYTAFERVDEVARTRDTVHLAEAPLDLGGRPAHVAVTLHPSCDTDGAATTSVIVVCIDITDEVCARRLGVDADALVWSGPLDNDPDYFNHRWSAYIGRDSAWQHAVHALDVLKCSEALRWATRERGSIDVEARIARANGDWRWHRVRFEVDGSARWFGTAVDIHDARNAAAERNDLLAREREARADAEQANRLKDQFLGVVSHELRAPLTTMVLWENILRDDANNLALRTKALDAIRQSAQLQSRVVGDLLDVSRAIAGKLHIDLRPIELERVVGVAIEEITPSAVEKQIVLERRGDLTGVSVQADAVRLRQVLGNVLSNAVKFTGRGGRVTISLSRRGRSVVIEVADSGVGIEAEVLPRLFEAFSQTDDSTMSRGTGLGIGLAIAKQLVELHHGTIAATSAGPGSGTMLTIVLPVSAEVATSPSGLTRDMPRGLDLTHTRVLVVDDDPRVRDALALLLGRAGAIVETAGSAELARARISGRAPHVLVCDIAMPIEDGYSLISGLRAGGSDVPAIALTAYATATDVERALAAGFDRHVAKPVDIETLVAIIDELTRAPSGALAIR